MSYWFYNVTNAEEFLSQKTGEYVRPRLSEIGPYVFRYSKKKLSDKFYIYSTLLRYSFSLLCKIEYSFFQSSSKFRVDTRYRKEKTG